MFTAGCMILYYIYIHNYIRVFSRDFGRGNIGVLAGGRGVLGVQYLLENIIHYYYCQSEGGGKTAVKGGLICFLQSFGEVIVSSRFRNQRLFFFGVRKNVLRKVIHLKVRKNVLRKVIHLKVNEERN